MGLVNTVNEFFRKERVIMISKIGSQISFKGLKIQDERAKRELKSLMRTPETKFAVAKNLDLLHSAYYKDEIVLSTTTDDDGITVFVEQPKAKKTLGIGFIPFNAGEDKIEEGFSGIFAEAQRVSPTYTTRSPEEILDQYA